MESISNKFAQQSSFSRQSPRKNTYKLSYPPVPRSNALPPAIDGESTVVRVSKVPFNSTIANRNDIKDLETWTHSALAAIFQQEDSQNLDAIKRHSLQINILDQSMKKLADLIKVHCSDQANLLWKLWSSASDLYSEVFHGLASSIDELKVHFADKSIECQRWEEKYRLLKQQYVEEKANRFYGSEKNKTIRQLEEEIILKDKEMLELQDMATATSVWFPNFAKFGKSVLSRYLPPLEGNEDQSTNEEANDLISGKLTLAQGYLVADLKRLEHLGIGLQIHQQTSGSKLTSNIVVSVSKSNVETDSGALPYGLFGGVSHQTTSSTLKSKAIACASPTGEASTRDFYTLQHRRLSTRKETHDIDAEANHILNEEFDKQKMMEHLQELEAESIKLQADNDQRLTELQHELQLSQKREKALRDQLLAIQKQTRSVIHCLPTVTFSPSPANGFSLEFDPSTAFPSSNAIIELLFNFLEDFSMRQSVFSSSSYCSITFDNIMNSMNGQAVLLQNILPMSGKIGDDTVLSSQLVTLLFQHYCCRYASGKDASMKLQRLLASVYTLDGDEPLEKFVKTVFGVGKITMFDNSLDDSEFIYLLVSWFRAIKRTKCQNLMSLQEVQKSINRMFISPSQHGVMARSVFQELLDDGLSASTPSWRFLSRRRQVELLENIKKNSQMINAKPFVSIFTMYNLCQEAVTKYRETILQILEDLFNFVSTIVAIDPAQPFCFHLLLSCLLINPLKDVDMDFSHLDYSISFLHELSCLHLKGLLTGKSFASLVYKVFDNLQLVGLVELMDHLSDSDHAYSTLLQPFNSQLSDCDNFDPKASLDFLISTGRLYMDVLRQTSQEVLSTSTEKLKFQKDVSAALRLQYKRSSFADRMDIQSQLSSPCTSDMSSFTERIILHCQLYFDPAMQIGLSNNVQAMWFTVAVLMGFLPTNVTALVRETTINGLESQGLLPVFVTSEQPELEWKLETAVRHYNFKLMKDVFFRWNSNLQ